MLWDGAEYPDDEYWPDANGGAGSDRPELGTVEWIADFFDDRRDYVDGRINAAQ